MSKFDAKFFLALVAFFCLASTTYAQQFWNPSNPTTSPGQNAKDDQVEISNDMVEPKDFMKTVQQEAETTHNALVTKINTEQAEDDQAITAAAQSNGGSATTNPSNAPEQQPNQSPPPPSQPSSAPPINMPPPQNPSDQGNSEQPGGWNINY